MPWTVKNLLSAAKRAPIRKSWMFKNIVRQPQIHKFRKKMPWYSAQVEVLTVDERRLMQQDKIQRLQNKKRKREAAVDEDDSSDDADAASQEF
jgi:hypothetical protein